MLWVERNFHRARIPVTFVFPGNVSALLAGADGMSVPVFFGVALTSVALRLWAVRALAEVLRGPLLDVVNWIGDNQLWLTVVSVAGVMIWVGWSNRHGIPPVETVGEVVDDFAPRPADPEAPSDRADEPARRRPAPRGQRSRKRSGPSCAVDELGDHADRRAVRT